MQQMVTPDAALQLILDRTAPLPVENVSHEAALGRTLATDIVSSVELPPFDNSAMDGYAVVAADLNGATDAAPRLLRVLETVAAGDVGSLPVTSGHTAKIMTGAPLPPGADAVVMREDTRDADDQQVAIGVTAKPAQFIRRAGSDVRRGETVMRAGTVVRAAEWGMLASLDQAEVTVARQPRVAIVTTGEELVPLGTPLGPGQIRDSNSFSLDALARATGAQVVARQHHNDDAQALAAALREVAIDADVVITSGGVSAGDFDPVRDVLLQHAEVHFWRIAMKPGKPVMFATLPDAAGRLVPIFGLPGNPVSVMVAFECFVRPALLALQGRIAWRRVEVQAAVDAPVRSPAGKVEFVRAQVVPGAGGWSALIAGDQSSGRLSTMTRSNALLVVPEAVTLIEAGQLVTARMTDWPETE